MSSTTLVGRHPIKDRSEWDIGDFKPKQLEGYNPNPKPASYHPPKKKSVRMTSFEIARYEELKKWLSVREARLQELIRETMYTDSFVVNISRGIIGMDSRTFSEVSRAMKNIEYHEVFSKHSKP
jgi:hypothetical protein